MSSAIQVLTETEASELSSTVDMVHNLPALSYCANAEALDKEVAPPEDPDDARELALLRDELRLIQRGHRLICGRWVTILERTACLTAVPVSVNHGPRG